MRILACCCSLLPFLLCLPSAGAAERPNILWMIAEDMGPELGCYGTEQVWTPNIDRLAENGVRYTRVFTTAPVCSTSRSAFMTGMYQTTIGAHNHRSHRGDGYQLPAGVRLITHWLGDAGYYTANIGRNAKPVAGTGKTDWNFNYRGKAFDGDDWADLKSHQPFYAQINFPETHRGGDWDAAHNRIAKTADPDKVVIPPYYPDHPLTRQDWAQYLNTVMSLDQKVGKVLGVLEEMGVADDTIVIFMSDHGRAMIRGKQWPYDSGLHIPLIVRWAKNFPPPAGFEAGKVSDQLISSIDISATTLAIAGVEIPARMQGRVFLGEQAAPPREYVFSGRDRGDETVDRIRTVRDSRYRYIVNYYPDRPFLQLNRYKEMQYPVIHLLRWLQEKGQLEPSQASLLAATRPREELYDLQADPYEINNLTESPELNGVKQRLRTELLEWIEESDDQGRFPEDPAIVEKWDKEMSRIYDAKVRKRMEELRAQFEADAEAPQN